jgi:hypothetical protein
MFLYAFNPLLNVLKGPILGYIIDDQSAQGSAVVPANHTKDTQQLWIDIVPVQLSYC